jgi:hypothetical protein
MIFTARHYSRTTDTATTPRPTTQEATPGKATVEELLARWGPFQANAGTDELSGSTLTLRLIVSKDRQASAAPSPALPSRWTATGSGSRRSRTRPAASSQA